MVTIQPWLLAMMPDPIKGSCTILMLSLFGTKNCTIEQNAQSYWNFVVFISDDEEGGLDSLVPASKPRTKVKPKAEEALMTEKEHVNVVFIGHVGKSRVLDTRIQNQMLYYSTSKWVLHTAFSVL